MTVELNLIHYRYSIVTLVFFITYIIFQPPSTVLCRKIGPRVYLSVITFLWGLLMIGFGFVDDWGTMAGLRVVLGVLEVSVISCIHVLPLFSQMSRQVSSLDVSIFCRVGM